MVQALRHFWEFLQEDTWPSWIVSLLLIIIIIRFIFFPTLSFVTGSPLPLVVVESCSMYHDAKIDDWWFKNGEKYTLRGINRSEFISNPFYKGLNKGDIIMVWGRSAYKTGDVIIFVPEPRFNLPNPVIHRMISTNPISTLGDNNDGQTPFETRIPENTVMGKAVARIPLVGWFKLIFFELLRDDQNRGTCFSQSKQ